MSVVGIPNDQINSAAVEAAVAAVNDDKLRRMKEQGSFIAVAVSTRDQVVAALLAAVPYIEAEIRAKIADEIEAVRDSGDHYERCSLTQAADIVRGVARGTQEATK